MNIVFLNTMEKRTSEGRVTSAQVSIGESTGSWTVLWSGPEDGRESEQIWFQGTSWEEMLSAFRHGVAVKMGEGYEPLIDGMLDDRRTTGGLMSMLQCYGELNARDDLFDALKEWRRNKAIEERRAAYLIATNRMLRMISAFVPHTPEELKQIPGWGEARTSAYGADITAITSAYERSTEFPLAWVPKRLDPKIYTKWLYKSKENKYSADMERHRTNKSILNGIRDGCGLDELEATVGLQRRELLERLEQLDREGYDLAPLLERELAQLPDGERGKIADAIQAVGDKYLKPILRQVYSESELEGKPLDPIYERLRLMRLQYRRQKGRRAI